jgi:hypothetical protein
MYKVQGPAFRIRRLFIKIKDKKKKIKVDRNNFCLVTFVFCLVYICLASCSMLFLQCPYIVDHIPDLVIRNCFAISWHLSPSKPCLEEDLTISI